MIYFVDTENVGKKRVEVGEKDIIYYLVGRNIKIKGLENKNEGVYELHDNEFYIITNHNGGKNALDFILDSVLGNMIRKYGKNEFYYIVSADNGFSVICNFWQALGFNVFQVHKYELYLSLYSSLLPDISDSKKLNLVLQELGIFLSSYNICLILYDDRKIPYRVFHHILCKELNVSAYSQGASQISYYLYREVLDKW